MFTFSIPPCPFSCADCLQNFGQKKGYPIIDHEYVKSHHRAYMRKSRIRKLIEPDSMLLLSELGVPVYVRLSVWLKLD